MPFVDEVVKADDPRQPLHKIRRPYLKQLVREAGIEFDENTTTANELRRIIKSNNIDFSHLLGKMSSLGPREPQRKRLADVEEQLKSEKASRAALEDKVNKLTELLEQQMKVSAQKEDVAADVPYAQMERWNLMKLCKVRDIPVSNTDKKEDLVNKLEAHDNSADGR